MNHRSALIFAAALALVLAAKAQTSDPEVTAKDLQTHLRYLASDQLEGRGSGTGGNRKAAEYIESELRRYGVAPAGINGTYLQPFSFVSAVRLGTSNSLRLEGGAIGVKDLIVNTDFRPLGFSSSGSVEGPLVFAGYGISAPDKKYDDYEGIDVHGSIAVILCWAPDGESPRSEFARHTALREKARVARDKGAVAVILITGPANEQEDDILKLTFDQVALDSGIPIVSMKRSFLLPAFTAAGRDLKALQDTIKATRKPSSFALSGVHATMTTDVRTIKAQTANVVGLLEGVDSQLKADYLVLGAHFDHLGWGGPGSGSLRPDTMAIHNGADDNASGTSALLELAQKFASQKQQLGRSIVFAFFSGEELGTLGSMYYVNHPTVSLTQTVAMLNMDMVGRLENRSLTIGGSGTSPAWADLLQKYNKDSTFVFKLEPGGFGPSDHSSFYGKNIPVLFFFTGWHDDYHKPSDDWDKINYVGEEKVTRLIYTLARDIDRMNERPTYARVESPGSREGAGDTRSFSVTLGIVPDFGQSTEGMKVSAVQPNRPGEKAGLKAGDIITKMAGKKVLNIYDYMGILGELKVGDVVEIEVLRGGATVTMTATMEKRR
jgi:aminopeptidase YwaD